MRPLLCLPFLLVSCASAQDLPSVKDKAKGYVNVLAGADMHGRGYVLGGDSLAADWIAEQFDRLGAGPLNGQRFERFGFAVNSFPDSVRMRVDGRALVPGVDFIVDPASGKADGHYDLVRLTTEDLLTPERRSMTMGVVTGKAVLLDFPQTKAADSLALFAELEEEVGRYAHIIKRAHGKLTWSVANEQARNAIIEVREGLVPDTAASVDLRVRPKLISDHRARNVFGVVPAKGGSKEWLVITAHYDHLGHMGPDVIFPGANDNASGISMMLCLAEEIKRKPLKKNVLFIAFAGEEAGLQGSQWCVVDRPMDFSKVKLLINLDLNGTGEEGITVVNAVEQKQAFDAITAINERTHRLPQVKSRGPACNSDHCPFAMKGIPAIFIYTMGGISAYHDVFDKAETLPLTEFDDLYRTLLDLVSTL